MSMALKADVTQACRYEGTEKPVDLVHLSKVTMGDRGLELEVLKMFLTQIPNYISTITQGVRAADVRSLAFLTLSLSVSLPAFADLPDLPAGKSYHQKEKEDDEPPWNSSKWYPSCTV